MKKRFSMLLAIAMMVTMLSGISFANDGCEAYPNITLSDGKDFTIVDQGVVSVNTIKVQGLDASWAKHDFTDVEDDYITWTTSNSSNVAFLDGYNVVNSITGTDTASLIVTGEGTATVTITYDTPDDNPVTVTSYVVSEGTSITNSVSNVDVEIKGQNSDSFTMPNINIPRFNLKNKGICSNDNDVLQNSPSALHALLYALEVHYSSETELTNINNFDWDWVKGNVTIESEGSYVRVIKNDANDYTKGWQFELNSVSLKHSASATSLDSGDDVKWEYKEFTW